MQFVLAGFQQNLNIRRYTFEGIDDHRKRKEVTVDADMGLIQKYKIPLQELPLLCRRLVEGRPEVDAGADAIRFTEDDMLGYAKDRATAASLAEQKRKSHRAPVSDRVGQAWRTR
ncbi:MAG: hypothetical protein ACRD30_08150 [Bryobacteraceae bacterium]